MNNKGSAGIVIICLIILVILIWGFIGGNETKSVGITCDMGVGDLLCWKWHKNIIGQAEEAINNVIEGLAAKSIQNTKSP